MTHDIRKSGIPVLAYPNCDAAPLSLSLMFRFNEVRATASLLLQSLLLVDGRDAKQTFVLQYDADNLRPGRSSLGPATIPLPQKRLDEVSREGNPQIRTLTLTLKKACPMWCHHDAVRPRSGHEAAIHQLANLAKATTLHILFDYNWLHRDHRALFQRLIDHPEQLTGFPVWRHYSKQYRREDWSVFTTQDVQDEATTEDEAPVGEGPPVYAESSKRPRHVTPTPSSPPAKRILLSPYPDSHTSPTEKDSITTPSPRLPHSSAAPSPICSPLAALTPGFPHSAASSPQYPHLCTETQIPSQEPPSHDRPDVLRAVEQVISTILPNMLDTLLPSLLPRLLAASSLSPFSQNSTASQISTAPLPPQLSALGVSLGEHMTRRIENELSSLYHHTVSHANHLRSAADAQFFDEREGERLAFERVADLKFNEFKEQIEGFGEAEVERVGWKMDKLGNKVAERVDWVKEGKAALKKEKEEITLEKKEIRLERDELRRDRQELRADKEDFRRQKRQLRREREVLHAAGPSQGRSYNARGARAGSAPA